MLAPQEIPVTRVIDALEQDNSITECTSDTECCSREAVCTIKTPMHALQERMSQVFNSVTIAQLL
jgi:DNA-binding IscR family transcriptional regulator